MRRISCVLVVCCAVTSGCEVGEGSYPDTESFCGDGIARGAEACDRADLRGRTCATVLGALFRGDLACTGACTLDLSGCERHGVCGDHVPDVGEECDDGNLVDCDGCSSTCTVERRPRCGNGVKECAEECDGGDFGGASCRSLGLASGALECSAACRVSTAACLPQGELRLAAEQLAPAAVTVADAVSHVYWLNQGRTVTVGGSTGLEDGFELMRVHTVGEPPTRLAAGSAAAHHLAVDDRYVYWSQCTEGKGQLMRMALQGTVPKVAVENRGCIQDLRVDRHHLYWIEANGAVMRAALDGSAVTLLHHVAGRGWIGALALDEHHVYWTEAEASCVQSETKGVVMGMPLEGGAPFTVAAEICCSHALATDGTFLYYAACGELLKVAVAGGKPTRITDLGGAHLYGGLVVDETHAFFPRGEGGDAGGAVAAVDVMKVPLSGGVPWSIARTDALSSFTISPTHVFWTEQGAPALRGASGEVWMADK